MDGPLVLLLFPLAALMVVYVLRFEMKAAAVEAARQKFYPEMNV